MKCYNTYMKKIPAPQEAKIFKFKFTTTMIVLAAAAIALCGAGIGLSVWQLLQVGIRQFTDVLKYPFLIAISAFGIVILIALLIRSRYLITDTQLILQFGILKNRYDIKNVTSLLLDTDTRKLSVYMGEEFFVVITDPEWNNDFVQAIRAINPSVEFSFTLAEPNNSDKK